MQINSTLPNLNDEKLVEDLRACAPAHATLFSAIEIHNLEISTNYRFDKLDLTAKQLRVITNGYIGSVSETEPMMVTVDQQNILFYTHASIDVVDPEDLLTVKQGDNVLAYYDKENHTLYMPYSIEDLSEELIRKLYTLVLSEFFNVFDEAKEDEFNWTRNTKQLKKNITRKLSAEDTEKISTVERELEHRSNLIRNYKQELERFYKERIHYMRELENLQNPSRNNFSSFFESIDMISNHKNVSKVRILDNGQIEVTVDDIRMYAEIKGEEKCFYLGSVKIVMSYMNSSVRFLENGNGRKGFWSRRSDDPTVLDAHPHVNGRDGIGEPCLGSVEQTILELSTQREMYALFLTCLDFLENANTEDTAGAHVVAWDMIDEDGTIIKEGRPVGRDKVCDCCMDYYSTDDMEFFDVATSYVGNGEVDTFRTWCDDCTYDKATFNDHAECYVTHRLNELIDEYVQEQEYVCCEHCSESYDPDEERFSDVATSFEEHFRDFESWCEKCVDEHALQAPNDQDVLVTDHVYELVEFEESEENNDEEDEESFPVYAVDPNDSTTTIVEEWTSERRESEAHFSEQFSAYFTTDALALVNG